MIRSRFILFVLLAAALTWPGAGRAADEEAAEPAAKPAVEKGKKGDEPELWFPIGERLKYRIYWGTIPVGYSVASTRWVEEDGKKLLLIRFRTRTNKVLRRLYPVDDIIESYVDPETFLPVRFVKNLKEGRYRCHEITEFNHKKLKAKWRSELNEREKEYEIKEDTRDIVSFMYYTRAEPFEDGEEREFQVMADEKLYDLYVKVVGREDVKVVGGDRISSLKMEPEAAFEGLFVRKGKMWLWVAEEDPRVVTRVAAKVPVASVKLVLEEVGVSGEDDALPSDEEEAEAENEAEGEEESAE